MSSIPSSSSFTSAESLGSLSSRGSAQGGSSREEVGLIEEASGSGVRGSCVDAADRLAAKIAEDSLSR